MKNYEESYTLVVDGESGSGKSEMAKHIVEYLTNMRTIGVAGGAGPGRANPANFTNRRVENDEGPLGSHIRPFIGRGLTELGALVMEAHVVFEAFGHAKTLANDNSSKVRRRRRRRQRWHACLHNATSRARVHTAAQQPLAVLTPFPGGQAHQALVHTRRGGLRRVF
mmetsp:Transcript_75676/g.215397  ORF Transcript_75676/g.215397 Transcript_75676/m.215397 type:complete len:167 (-) Transcript_75676:735-1235(-)